MLSGMLCSDSVVFRSTETTGGEGRGRSIRKTSREVESCTMKAREETMVMGVKELYASNKKLQYSLMSEGLNDLLRVHSNEELVILSQTLGVETENRRIEETKQRDSSSEGGGEQKRSKESRGSGNETSISHGLRLKAEKEKLISVIFEEKIQPYQEKLSQIDLAFMNVLREVWDGLMLEYLSEAGKNLRKCRMNIRKAVMKHWKRDTIDDPNELTLSQGAFEFSPSFMLNCVWNRKPERSKMKELVEKQRIDGISEVMQVDEQVDKYLTAIEANEEQLKATEKKLRLFPDHLSGRDFMKRIVNVRQVESKLRNYLLSNYQRLLRLIEYYHMVFQQEAQEKKRGTEERKQQNLLSIAKNRLLFVALRNCSSALSRRKSEVERLLKLNQGLEARNQTAQEERSALENQFHKECEAHEATALELEELKQLYTKQLQGRQRLEAKNKVQGDRIGLLVEDGTNYIAEKLLALSDAEKTAAALTLAMKLFSNQWLSSIVKVAVDKSLASKQKQASSAKASKQRTKSMKAVVKGRGAKKKPSRSAKITKGSVSGASSKTKQQSLKSNLKKGKVSKTKAVVPKKGPKKK